MSLDEPQLPELLHAAEHSRRRLFTLGGAAVAVAFGTRLADPDTAVAAAGSKGYPFTLSVASGDPRPDSVVIWTRLAPSPLEPLGGLPYRDFRVRWEVARDERFRDVVRRGVATARVAYAHTVHVDVRGLDPSRVYHYRFRSGRHVSPPGRTKTAPAYGSRLDQLALGVVSCQSWPGGFYTAYRHLAEEDLDVVLHLGDYIYEYGIGASGGQRDVSVPAEFREDAETLDRYRIQYGLYKTDRDLQEAHERFAFMATWDDHEVYNNIAGGADRTQDQLVRAANGLRAFWEHMPLRRPQKPDGPDIRMYRRLGYGDLATFNMLDVRQYRSDHACGTEGNTEPCEEVYDPDRTMLGFEQERWLLDGLAGSDRRWNVLANPVVLSKTDTDPGEGELYGMDNWNGYQAARERLFDGIVERDVDNFVVLSGDAHFNTASNLPTDYYEPGSPTIGVEFLGTSITTGGDGVDMDAYGEKLLAANEDTIFYNRQRGYIRCLVSRDEWRSDFRITPYISRRGGPIQTRASFTVENGRPGLEVT